MLLLDENLSPRLVGALAKDFPGSVHVHDQQLGGVDDFEVWHFARSEGLTIVTKDGDFADIQGVKGYPPKIDWIRRGNASTAVIIDLLRDHKADIVKMVEDPGLGILILT